MKTIVSIDRSLHDERLSEYTILNEELLKVNQLERMIFVGNLEESHIQSFLSHILFDLHIVEYLALEEGLTDKIDKSVE